MHRSLERLMSWAEVPFAPSVDSSEPEPEELGRVEKILAEADEEEYWFAASKDGNRVSHYRGLHNYTDLLRESQPQRAELPKSQPASDIPLHLLVQLVMQCMVTQTLSSRHHIM